MSEIHVGDISTVFQFQVLDEAGAPVDLSAHTTLLIIFNCSGIAPLVKTAQLVNGGGDGLVQYQTLAGDLSVAGMWSAEVNYALTNGEMKHTNIVKFQVFPNLAVA